MKKFNWKKFGEDKLAVRCITEKEAENFCKHAEKRGYNWLNGGKRSSDTSWCIYANHTAYAKDTYCDFGTYLRDGYEIVNWFEYMNPIKRILISKYGRGYKVFITLDLIALVISLGYLLLCVLRLF